MILNIPFKIVLTFEVIILRVLSNLNPDKDHCLGLVYCVTYTGGGFCEGQGGAVQTLGYDVTDVLQLKINKECSTLSTVHHWYVHSHR